MNVKEAIKRLGAPPVGFTSLVEAIHGGDMRSVSGAPANGVPTLETAKKALELAKEAQANCQSDAAWWGYLGQTSYWQAAVHVLEAAEILGADNLPDMRPARSGVLMDQCAALENYGNAMLEAARNNTANNKVSGPEPAAKGSHE